MIVVEGFERESGGEVYGFAWLEGDVEIQIASDEPTGDREWKIIEVSIAHKRLIETRVPPAVPEGELLDEIRKAFNQWVREEGVPRAWGQPAGA